MPCACYVQTLRQMCILKEKEKKLLAFFCIHKKLAQDRPTKLKYKLSILQLTGFLLMRIGKFSLSLKNVVIYLFCKLGYNVAELDIKLADLLNIDYSTEPCSYLQSKQVVDFVKFNYEFNKISVSNISLF